MASTDVAGRRGWRQYWADKQTPLHAGETEKDFRELGAELRLLFAGQPVDRVLEIGCGNGAMFSDLGFDTVSRYLGIDFSEAMLAEFTARFPTADLVVADAATFRAAEEFDLVLSSHVAQYWSPGQLAEHLEAAASMLARHGSIVVAGIPWSRLRLAYARGDLTGGDRTGGPRRSLPRALIEVARERLVPDIGQWYDLPELTELAASLGLRASFRGSGYYPYRFHAIFRRPEQQA